MVRVQARVHSLQDSEGRHLLPNEISSSCLDSHEHRVTTELFELPVGHESHNAFGRKGVPRNRRDASSQPRLHHAVLWNLQGESIPGDEWLLCGFAEDLDEVEGRHVGLGPLAERAPVDRLALEHREEALGHGVVEGNRQTNACVCQGAYTGVEREPPEEREVRR